MLQTEPARNSGIWFNLPLRVKAAACFLLPLPLLALTVIGLGMLGFHRFYYLILPGAVIELVALGWVLQAVHRRIEEIEFATESLCEGEPFPPVSPYSFELNAIDRNLALLATTLQRRERELAECREQAARMFEDTPAAYLETDANGIVQRASRGACQLLQCTTEAICRTSVWELFGAADGSEIQAQALGKFDSQEVVAPFEEQYARRDGVQLTLEVRVSPVHDLHGKLTGVRYFLSDLTPRVIAAEAVADCEKQLRLKDEQLEKALAEAAEARGVKSRFLSSASNDMRVPLNTIVGFTELMLDGKIGSKAAERRECLGDILSSARELTGLINHLLDPGKWEPIAPAPRHENASLETFVYDVGHLMQVVSKGSAGRIQVDLDPDLQNITTDREALRQLVGFYLSYAFKRVPDGGEVLVRTAAEGSSSYRLEVEYIGADGQDDALLPRDLETEAELAQVKQLVEKHGGRAGVYTAPGRGTVLYAILHTMNEFARRRAGAGAVIESVAPDAEVLQGLAKMLGEIGNPDAISSLEGNARPRLTPVAAPGRKRSA